MKFNSKILFNNSYQEYYNRFDPFTGSPKREEVYFKILDSNIDTEFREDSVLSLVTDREYVNGTQYYVLACDIFEELKEQINLNYKPSYEVILTL